MKIEKITICNLTSIEGEQVIDFRTEPLRSAGLFAITGDTGAGKSTLLDAVCLALYNEAPRFDDAENVSKQELSAASEDETPKIKARDVRNMLRRGCREGHSIVEFSTNGGSLYEAGWFLRVKRTGTYDRPTRTLRRLSPGKERVEEQDIPARIVEITGLDYQQFTRTVLLAQNSFANFLKARRDEKSALLEKLTGTEIYGRISQKIFELARQSEQQLALANNSLETLLRDRLDEHELARLNEEKRLCEASLRGASKQRETAERRLQWLDSYEAARQRVEAAETRAAAAHKDYVAMRAAELELERYDEVLRVQPLYQEIIVRRKDIDDLKSSEDESAARLDELRGKLREQAARLDRCRERSADAGSRLAQRRPVINRGHTLTGEIGMAERQLAKAEEQLAKAEETMASRKAATAEKRARLAATRSELERLQLHVQALSAHRLMFDKYDLIKDKLTALRGETQRNETAHRRYAELQRRQAQLKASVESVARRQHDDQAALESRKSELLIHRQANQGRESSLLQRRASENSSRLLGLEHAKRLWQRISRGYDELETRQAELERRAVQLDQTTAQLEKATSEAKTLDEACKRLNVAFTLSQSENIVQLRQRLKEGTACPVCGATHHPYHTETERELGELLSGIEKEFNEARDALAAKRAEEAALRDEKAAGEAFLKAAKDDLAERAQRQRADEDDWQTCAGLDPSFGECSPSVNRDARRTTIEMLMDNTRREAEEAEKELANFDYHQKQINRLNEEISAIDARMADNHSRLDSLSTQAQIASASLEEVQESLDLSDRSCSELYTDLDEMVTLSGWFTDWKNNPDNFRLRLTDVHKDWLQTCAGLDEAERSEALLSEEVKGAETAEAEETRHVASCREEKAAAAERLAEMREELRRLFGSSSPEKEAEELEKDIEACRKEEAKAREACETATGALRQMEGTRQNLLENRLARQAELREKMSELDLWILRFNSSHSPVQFAELERIFSDRRDWKALRGDIDRRKHALALAKNEADTERAALVALQAESERAAEDGPAAREALQRAIEEADSRIEALAARQGAIGLRLAAHESCLRQAEEMAPRIEEAKDDYEQWSRLSQLLGSADGKAFRRLAQSHTFRFLVEQANVHLHRLSPRYEMRCLPGTLTLEIVDRDMFDERRYVNSLSGGETFVVSLALALGLASLSGSGLSIGSLFIDEGFGNLDHASLELVMSALGNLENAEGRKVGVISHTDQIRSQISPQIRLVKLPTGGRSRIEIV